MAKPVYALVGADCFLQLQKLAEIRAQLPKDVQAIDIDGERAELAEVLDELRSFAMFGSGKLVVVRNGDEFVSRFRQQLEDYVANPSDSGTLVLRLNSLNKTHRIAKLMIKNGVVEACEPPKQHELPRWIAARGKSAHKLAIDAPSANLLAELVGNDLGRLDNELAKLALQVDGGKVTPEAILGSVSFQREQEMWDLTNELAMGRPAEALRRWRQLIQLDTSAEYRAVTWLTMWLEEVDTILSGGNTGKMSWKYKDRLGQFIKTANAIGKTRYAKAVTLLADLDRRTKTGVGNAAGNVEQFILSFAS